jgi:N-acylneuraminate cytidylyltransferase
MIPLIGGGFFNKRRQDLPDVFTPNGAVYVAETEFLKRNNSFYSDSTTAYIMPKELSLDIDTELDLIVFEALMEQHELNI